MRHHKQPKALVEGYLQGLCLTSTLGGFGNSTTGTITINGPGLRQATSGSEAVTAEASYSGNIAFHRNAAEIAMRAPALPAGGDVADDAMIIQDPFSGMVFEVRAYKGYKKAMFEVATAFGVKAWKDEFISLIQG